MGLRRLQAQADPRPLPRSGPLLLGAATADRDGRTRETVRRSKSLSYADDEEDKPPAVPGRAGSVPFAGAEMAPVVTGPKGSERINVKASATVKTDAAGKASITFTEPGWHRIKATVVSGGAEGAIRSNRLDVCVSGATATKALEGATACGELPAADQVRGVPRSSAKSPRPQPVAGRWRAAARAAVAVPRRRLRDEAPTPPTGSTPATRTAEGERAEARPRTSRQGPARGQLEGDRPRPGSRRVDDLLARRRPEGRPLGDPGEWHSEVGGDGQAAARSQLQAALRDHRPRRADLDRVARQGRGAEGARARRRG